MRFLEERLFESGLFHPSHAWDSKHTNEEAFSSTKLKNHQWALQWLLLLLLI